MKRRDSPCSKTKGQSLVEFMLTCIAFFTFLFMVVQVFIGFGVANYFQYATFMAARALLPGRGNPQAQISTAKSVLSYMVKRGEVDRFPSFAKGSGGGTPEGFITVGASPRVSLGADKSRDNSWEQGAAYRFKLKLYMMPMVRGAKSGSKNALEIQSETWLGRDPSENECRDQLARRKQGIGSQREWSIDNGC
jgi:hypothetical protein